MEPLVSSFRNKYDPSAAKGMPAHITINYPFIPGLTPDQNLYQRLADLFAESDSFTFTFKRFGRFPGVVYLVPEPDAPFKELIEKVARKFPQSPPYGGIFETIVPHLTIAHAEEEAVLDEIESQLTERAQQHLPMTIQAKQVRLTDNRTGRWQERKVFQLGSS